MPTGQPTLGRLNSAASCLNNRPHYIDIQRETDGDQGLLSVSDHSLVARALQGKLGHPAAVTWQEVKDVAARLSAEKLRREKERESWRPSAAKRVADVQPSLWPEVVRIRRRVTMQNLPDACRALVFYVDDAATTSDWMGHGSREAYLRDGLRTNPHLVEYARAGMRFWPNYKPQEVSAPPGVTIFRGVQPDTPALDVPREGWPLQISSRRIGKSEVIYCCSTLIFYVKDAETTGDWIGYGSREAHLRDGLGVEPEVIDWAEEVVRQFGDER